MGVVSRMSKDVYAAIIQGQMYFMADGWGFELQDSINSNSFRDAMRQDSQP